MLRILIVEDTPARQKILCDLARDHAWVAAPTARRAVTLLQAFEFDLVFLDYDLAGEEKGDVVAACLAGLPRQPAIVVHSQNRQGAAHIRQVVPEAQWVPIAAMTRTNAVFKQVREALARGAHLPWRELLTEKA